MTMIQSREHGKMMTMKMKTIVISIVMAMMTIQPGGNPDRVDMGRMPMNASRGRRQGGSCALGLSGEMRIVIFIMNMMTMMMAIMARDGFLKS